MIPLKFLNTRGLPAIESIKVDQIGTINTVTFNNHPYLNTRFAGGFWVKIGQQFDANASPVQFVTDGVSNSAVTLYNTAGEQATGADLVSDGQGVHLCFYDSESKRLTLLV